MARSESALADVKAMSIGQISKLRREVDLQNSEISCLRHMNTAYLGHIGVLEGALRMLGHEPPALVMPAFEAQP